MSAPRYVPKSYAVRSHEFGKSRHIEWRQVDESNHAERVELVAAQIQHRFAVEILAAIHRKHPLARRKGYAQAIDRTTPDKSSYYHQLGAILRGDAVMQLRDIARARVHFGDLIPDLVDTEPTP